MDFAESLSSLASNMFCCKGVAALLWGCILQVSEHMDATVRGGCSSLDYSFLAGASRMHRPGAPYDKGVRLQLREQVLVKRKSQCLSGSQCLVSASDSTWWKWLHDDLLVQCRCNVRLFNGGGVFILKSDATRLARPGKETIHYTLRSGPRNVATYLAPQAVAGGRGCEPKTKQKHSVAPAHTPSPVIPQLQ